MDLKYYRQSAREMASILGLSRSPVGVRFLIKGESVPEEACRLDRHRYCQALMLAGYEESVILNESGIACPAAAAAFGFRSLPEGLTSGKGLVGFGIVADPEVGKEMFVQMPRIAAGRPRKRIRRSPLMVRVPSKFGFTRIISVPPAGRWSQPWSRF